MTIFSAQNWLSILISHTPILPHKHKWLVVYIACDQLCMNSCVLQNRADSYMPCKAMVHSTKWLWSSCGLPLKSILAGEA